MAVNVAIGGVTSATVTAVDNKPLSALTDAVSAPCIQAAVRGNDDASASTSCRNKNHDSNHRFEKLIKGLKKTSNLRENIGTVEYFACQ